MSEQLSMTIGSQTLDWLAIANTVSSIVVALAAALAAFYAARGLGTWRSEMKGRKKYELAEEILVSLSEAREVFHWMRSPGAFQYEYQELERKEDESEDEYALRAQFSLASLRYGKYVALFGKLRSAVFRVKVHFGESHTAPIKVVLSAVDDVLHAGASAHMRARQLEDLHRRAEKTGRSYDRLIERATEKFDEADRKYSAVRDELSDSVDQAVSNAEKLFRSALI